jgi:hypothetical protein
MKPPNESCATCRNFVRYSEQHKNGECRAGLPQLWQDLERCLNIGVWPEVSDDAWCSHYREDAVAKRYEKTARALAVNGDHEENWGRK